MHRCLFFVFLVADAHAFPTQKHDAISPQWATAESINECKAPNTKCGIGENAKCCKPTQTSWRWNRRLSTPSTPEIKKARCQLRESNLFPEDPSARLHPRTISLVARLSYPRGQSYSIYYCGLIV